MVMMFGIVFLYFCMTIVIRSSLEKLDHASIEREAFEYKAAFSKGGISSVKKKYFEEAPEDTTSTLTLVFFDKDKNLIFATPHRESLGIDVSDMAPDHNFKTSEWTKVVSKNKSISDVFALTLANNGYFAIAMPTSNRENIISELQKNFLFFALFSIVISTMLSHLLASRALIPLDKFLLGLKSVIGSGDISARISSSSPIYELNQLSVSFNVLLEKIESIISQMKQDLEMVAHEIKTPLTRIKLEVDKSITDNNADVHDLHNVLINTSEEVTGVARIINTLLDTSEAGITKLNIKLEPVNLSQICEEVSSSFQILAEDKNVELIIKIADNIIVEGDKFRLNQVVSNLLDNAVKYTPQNQKITISLSILNNMALLEISDTGPGISEREMKLIWNKFYRANTDKSAPGIGLGLALVKAIVIALKGRVYVKNSQPNGACFVVELPISNSIT